MLLHFCILGLLFCGSIICQGFLHLLQLAGGLLFAPLGCRLALTAGLLLGNRNMGLLLVALPAGSDPDIGLFLAVGQIPIYTLPALTLPIYRKLLRPQKGKPSDGV